MIHQLRRRNPHATRPPPLQRSSQIVAASSGEFLSARSVLIGFTKLSGNTERSFGKTEHMKLLGQLLCSQVRAEIFRVLFGLLSNEIHLRELQRQTGFAVGTVRQDIEKLVGMNLVTRRADGNRVCYSANRQHPLYEEIHRLVLKTSGLGDVLAESLTSDRVTCAFVFGSIAANTAGPESDIDLMVVGEIGLRKLTEMLSGVGIQLGRELNPFVLTPNELQKRVRTDEHFVKSVLAGPKIFIVGDNDVLRTMVG